MRVSPPSRPGKNKQRFFVYGSSSSVVLQIKHLEADKVSVRIYREGTRERETCRETANSAESFDLDRELSKEINHVRGALWEGKDQDEWRQQDGRQLLQEQDRFRWEQGCERLMNLDSEEKKEKSVEPLSRNCG